MRTLLCTLTLTALMTTTVIAEEIAVDDPRWQLMGAETGVVEYQGRRALHLRGAIATLPDANFDTGVIEFDMAVPSARSFPGIYFRGQDAFNYEHFYLRPHQNGNPDTMQYTPVINGATGWQIYSEYNARQTLRINEWLRVRMEVAGDSARIFIDGEEPSLIVHDLKRARAVGYVQLRGSLGGAYFANISITPSAVADATAEPPSERAPDNLVRAWRVSAPMAQADAFAAADANRLDGVAWSRLDVETNGIANLARVATRSDETPTVLARFSVRSDRARSAPMRFGFSDQVNVYLNGTLLYSGDDTQNSRDYRFLGTVGWYDTLHLPLRRGVNDIVFAVSEGGEIGGGGWAATAALPDITGLTVVAP